MLVAGEALQPISTATSVKVRNGEMQLYDGPFAETKEQLGGYYLLECCCHPALHEQASVALTLKTLCGLRPVEIARAFVSSESAIKKRITRTKHKIKTSGIKFDVPNDSDIPKRINQVLRVIYLIYNESYIAYEGQTLSRNDLAHEALRLAKLVYRLTQNPEAAGLVSLITLNQARRVNQKDNALFVPLEHQDRTQWDQNDIKAAVQLLEMSIKPQSAGPFQIQAAISALHCQATSWHETDWTQIILLYQSLYNIESSPVILLKKWLAIAHSGQVKKAYKEILLLHRPLHDYQPFYAAKAYLETKLGYIDQAINSYRSAIELTANNPNRDYLIQELDKLKTKCLALCQIAHT